MVLNVRLPWELEEEILSRLPPQSLVRLRAVCNRWNSLFKDKSFINKHLSLSRPQFIFLTESKIYLIDIIDHAIDLQQKKSYGFAKFIDYVFNMFTKKKEKAIDLRELHFSCSRDLNLEYGTITTCDDLLFCKYPDHWKKETALWNPWLRQVNWIKLSVHKDFEVFGLGYDDSGPQKVHKILLYLGYYIHKLAIYECASQALRYIDTPDADMPIPEEAESSHVSLYGNLYWIAYNLRTREYFIQSFDFTREVFKPVCLLPLQANHRSDKLVLAVYKGDQFSLLKQCFLTRKIEIWVMENKIDDFDSK
ncbi:Protein SUPPRESSOR OF NIM1 1 [Raphanus sativus]|nr:Protein SUPPRESSOR OF NIM1 1 [Raphanus sativus]